MTRAPCSDRWILSTLASLCVILATGDDGDAQIRDPGPPAGLVLDAVSRQPVSGATVSVLGTPIVVLTDPGGRFRLPSLPGRDTPHQIRVERIGYAPRIFTLGEPGASLDLLLELKPEAVSVEGLTVTVTGLRERFERRRNAARGIVFAYDTRELVALGADHGFDLFWKIVRLARPCPGAGTDYCITQRGHDVPVRVCIDEQRAWGGVLQLAQYRPEDFFLMEVYGWGRMIRAYTNDWVRRYGTRSPLRPLDWGC